jgi:hypothetical protein
MGTESIWAARLVIFLIHKCRYSHKICRELRHLGKELHTRKDKIVREATISKLTTPWWPKSEKEYSVFEMQQASLEVAATPLTWKAKPLFLRDLHEVQ